MKIHISEQSIQKSRQFFEKWSPAVLFCILTAISVAAFVHYLHNGLGVAYNDARSHLDIGRRVVEGLNTGAAQLGSVWLPLTHLLMAVTIWNDFMWHTGLAGALQSMIAFVAIGLLIYQFLKELGASMIARYAGVFVFVANVNILYLQSTAMTELMLMGTMTAGAYCFLRWYKSEDIYYLVVSAFWIMLSTLVRYDGWFLFFLATLLIAIHVWYAYSFEKMEGTVVLFCTLGGFGIIGWLVWNLLIFGDPLYFALGPYSAHAQQEQLNAAGVLPTKYQWFESAKVYWYALAYDSGTFTLLLGIFGATALWTHKKVDTSLRIASVLLVAPWLFNIIALYLGHSVLYIQGLSGETWFNVRYGILMMPSLAIFVGYLIHRLKHLRVVLIGLLLFVAFFQFSSGDAATIDDATVGSSQKNVTEVAGWLHKNTKDVPGFVLISAASHDSVIFSSGLPMMKFIHEGTGTYYDKAIEFPDRWARWIVLRTYSEEDSTWRLLKNNPGFTERYTLVDHYPFADVYQLKDEYLPDLNTEPTLNPKVKK